MQAAGRMQLSVSTLHALLCYVTNCRRFRVALFDSLRQLARSKEVSLSFKSICRQVVFFKCLTDRNASEQ